MNIQKVLLKVWRAIRDFVARCIDSSVARESKKTSCAALRSNASKNAFIKSSKNASQKACGSCTRRALLSLFVASATLLATFVIAPAYALSAGENAGESAGANTASTEKVEGAKSGSAKNDGESNKQPDQSESNSAELNKKNTGSSSTLTNNNKESNPVEKQQNANKNGVDKPKSDEAAVNKKVKDAQKKDVDSTESVKGTDRGANEEPQLPPECKGNKNHDTLATCYGIDYSKIKLEKNYTKVNHILTPIIKVAGKSQKKFALPQGAWLELGHKDTVYKDDKDGYDFAFFKDKKGNYTAKSTNNIANSDGSIRFFAGKWLVAGTYKFTVAIHYKNGSESKAKKITVKLEEKYLPNVKPGDLSLSVYDFVKEQDGVAVSGNKITIKPKSSSQGASGGTTGSTDKKDVYDSINNKLFIESQSKDKIGFIYHHMICKTGSGNNASYTVDSVNGLSLGAQTQFEHKENLIRPKDGTAKDSAVYENDSYTERSQSWITGKPQNDGTFECKVFAVKDVELKRKFVGSGGPKDVKYEYSTVSKEFNSRVEADKQSLFDNPEQNIVEDKWDNKASIKQGVDWDYKSVTIEVKSSKPPEPEPTEIGDNDLTLKVYPFKNSDGSLPAELPDKNNKISAILGMSLKPFVDATSAADSKNKIALRVLCSKGEKKTAAGGGASTVGAGSSGSGSAVSGSSGDISSTGLSGANAAAGSRSSAQSGSQSEQSSGASQTAEDLEYKTWSSNLADLGLSVPADDNQNTCHSDKEGETTCVSVDPSKKVAARTDKEVSLKPTEVGDYQCVVFALKPDALTKFDDAISKATQSGSLTPTSISSALTSVKPTAFKENKDFAAFMLNIHSVSNFTLPHTGGQSWNLQLGILAALLVNLLAAGFVVSQSERGRAWVSTTFNRTVLSGFNAQDCATSSASNRVLKRTPASTRVNAHYHILNSVHSREANSIRSRVRDCVFACNRFYKDFCAVACSGVRSVKDFIRWVTERWRC
ncbi:hypothetical protein [Gardnerella sp. Marseille-Q2328]|uniref:hypothetical protein n=1 Tax=Gardnerella sp. Marseille-Q2328 TaxID=2759694 RepID=UPI002024D14A|nr:hypothetical protein [Gardnerella sp. Marseille-Q2328]